MDNLYSSLQKCILFKNKSLHEIEKLLSSINYKIESFQEYEIVFSPLQTADKIGIILSGTVDVQKLFPSGKIVILERKKSPDTIAEPSIFSKYRYYPSTVAVHKTVEILFIRKAELEKLFKIDSGFMMNYLESVSNSTLVLKHKIGILSLDSIQEKIAGYLIHDYNINGSTTVNLPFSKKAWAEYMNVSRTSLSRELRKLETEGILSFHQRKISIKEPDRLEQIISR